MRDIKEVLEGFVVEHDVEVSHELPLPYCSSDATCSAEVA